MKEKAVDKQDKKPVFFKHDLKQKVNVRVYYVFNSQKLLI